MSDSNNTLNQLNTERQIKFAVVMYGGGSLAIYINGVTQELLKMVQATDNEQTELSGTAIVYRKIALLLSDKESVVDKINEKQREIASSKDSKTLSEEKALLNELLKIPITTSFVIDVLTGSSAGGINAVFLSKAIVNNTNLDKLKELWMSQGDFAVLLNDKKSVSDNNLTAADSPKSLLNSQRMYLELLKALDGMENGSESYSLVKELDLYVTFTDFNGVPLPIKLSDKDIFERRHKQFFNFRYSKPNNSNNKADIINDFEKANNPFLAFAARATSAFPLAFEPMRLSDIDRIIEDCLPDYCGLKSDNPVWKKYFREIRDENGQLVKWENRSLVDGGCLDNKPFGYAIDKLSQRQAIGIVERKLLFIDPSAEAFPLEKADSEKPNAIENVIAQASGLPRYETIREDLQRLFDRNRLINRVNRIINDAEEDFSLVGKDVQEKRLKALKSDKKKAFIKKWPLKPLKEIDMEVENYFKGGWQKKALDELVEIKGDGAIIYYRLRISALTDSLAKLVTRYLKIQEDSDYFVALRYLMQVWRWKNFYEYEKVSKKDEKFVHEKLVKSKGEEPITKFLFDFDVEYRLRRVFFVMQKAENLLRKRTEIFESFKADKPSASNGSSKDNPVKNVKSAQEYKQGLVSEQDTCRVLLKDFVKDDKLSTKTVFDEELGKVVKYFQLELNNIYQNMLGAWHVLQAALAGGETTAYNLEEINKSLEFRTSLDKVIIAIAQTEIKEAGGNPEELNPDNSDDLIRISNLALQALNEIIKTGPKKCAQTADSGDQAELSRTAAKDLYSKDLYSKKPDAQPSLLTVGDLLNEAAKQLEIYLNKHIFKPSSDRAEILLGIEPTCASQDENAADPDRALISKEASVLPPDPNKAKLNKELVDFVSQYLKQFYEIFDSYDQISYPLFFDTPVGEAVEVDVVRVSSRDSHSLINEEERGEIRRKLAGDYLFAFGAFLDPKWRLNDIMWGRLDGAERLIETLLPGNEYEKHREELIKEANQIILEEMLIAKASDSFKNSIVTALTLAGTEAIEQNAVDKIVSSLTTGVIKNQLGEALTTCLSKEEIFTSVINDYEVNRQLEPKPTLNMISRATQVGGKILEDIAEKQAQAGDRLSWISRLGSIFWGLLTVAAPNSLPNLLFLYWLKLLYLFEAVLIVGGALLSTPEVQRFGITSLLVTVVLHLIVLTLHDLMKGNNFKKLPLAFLGILGLAMVVLGSFFLYVLLSGSEDLWKKTDELRKYLNPKDESPGFKTILPFIFPVFLTFSIFIWREIIEKNIRQLGLAVVFFALTLAAVGGWMERVASHPNFPPDSQPIIKLEFVENVAAFKEIVVPQSEDLSPPEIDKITQARKENLKNALLIDTFAFIPLYVTLFLFLTQLLALRRKDWFGRKRFLFISSSEAVIRWLNHNNKIEEIVNKLNNKTNRIIERLRDDEKEKIIGKLSDDYKNENTEKLKEAEKDPDCNKLTINGLRNEIIRELSEEEKKKIIDRLNSDKKGLLNILSYLEIQGFLKNKLWYKTNATWLAIIVSVLVIGAGVADCFENLHDYQLLNRSIDQLNLGQHAAGSSQVINWLFGTSYNWSLFNLIYGAATVKFILIFLVVALLSLTLLRFPTLTINSTDNILKRLTAPLLYIWPYLIIFVELIIGGAGLLTLRFPELDARLSIPMVYFSVIAVFLLSIVLLPTFWNFLPVDEENKGNWLKKFIYFLQYNLLNIFFIGLLATGFVSLLTTIYPASLPLTKNILFWQGLITLLLLIVIAVSLIFVQIPPEKGNKDGIWKRITYFWQNSLSNVLFAGLLTIGSVGLVTIFFPSRHDSISLILILQIAATLIIGIFFIWRDKRFLNDF